MGSATRYALGIVQGLMALFTTGAVIFEAHQYFLRYFRNEWVGLQISGVNDCRGEDSIANGDIVGGKTFCNHAENFAPWIEVYRHHPFAAVAYYVSIASILLVIAFAWRLSQKKPAADPTRQEPHGSPSDDGRI